MDKPVEWFNIARSAERGAYLLEQDGCFRSAVSRYYYAAYSAIHAVLPDQRQSPPVRGNWPHDGLSETLESVLTRGTIGVSERTASAYAKQLTDLYNLRIEADYGAFRRVDQMASREARKLSGRLMRFCERLVQA